VSYITQIYITVDMFSRQHTHTHTYIYIIEQNPVRYYRQKYYVNPDNSLGFFCTL